MSTNQILTCYSDDNFGSLLHEHELVSAFESQVQHQSQGVLAQPMELVDFRKPLMQWRNTRVMNRYVGKKLDERLATYSTRKHSKATIDLAIETYFVEKGINVNTTSKGALAVAKLDPEFRRIAIDQVKVFIFAGHDTTSGTISYALYKLGQMPSKMAAVRAELDRVFGPDADVAQSIKKDPYIINKLDYLTAVIRETLRLFAPANGMRRGQEKSVRARTP